MSKQGSHAALPGGTDNLAELENLNEQTLLEELKVWFALFSTHDICFSFVHDYRNHFILSPLIFPISVLISNYKAPIMVSCFATVLSVMISKISTLCDNHTDPFQPRWHLHICRRDSCHCKPIQVDPRHLWSGQDAIVLFGWGQEQTATSRVCSCGYCIPSDADHWEGSGMRHQWGIWCWKNRSGEIVHQATCSSFQRCGIWRAWEEATWGMKWGFSSFCAVSTLDIQRLYG